MASEPAAAEPEEANATSGRETPNLEGPDEKRLELSQQWLQERLQGLITSDFEDHVIFYCAIPLMPPPELRDIWLCAPKDPSEPLHQAVMQELCDASGPETHVVVLCDMLDAFQLTGLQQVQNALGVLHDSPPIIVAHHSVAVEHRGDEEEKNKEVTNVLEIGADAALTIQPKGLRFASAIRGRMQQCQAMTDQFTKLAHEAWERLQLGRQLQAQIQHLIWDYCCRRLVPAVPTTNPALETGPMPVIPGFRKGKFLGKGACGKVYSIQPEHLHGEEAGLQVIKSVAKEGFTDLHDLGSLRRTVEAMNRMNTDEYRHPHLTVLYEIYQTSTHILFRMQYGGKRNLYNVLTQREKAVDPEAAGVPPAKEFRSMLVQAAQGIEHLHCVAGIAHRDIKPENYTVTIEAEGKAKLMLTDFEHSIIVTGAGLCRHKVGTFPFVAPEVVLESCYEALLADIWSFGIVVIEIFCGVRKVERMLNLSLPQGEAVPDNEATNTIKDHFAVPGNASNSLRTECRSDMNFMLQPCETLVDSMLVVDPPGRVRATDVAAAVKGLTDIPVS